MIYYVLYNKVLNLEVFSSTVELDTLLQLLNYPENECDVKRVIR